MGNLEVTSEFLHKDTLMTHNFDEIFKNKFTPLRYSMMYVVWNGIMCVNGEGKPNTENNFFVDIFRLPTVISIDF